MGIEPYGGEVKDHGEGIPLEHQPEIFDRFYRAQKNDQYKGQGFGIGLSYVKTIIEAQKKWIGFEKYFLFELSENVYCKNVFGSVWINNSYMNLYKG